MPTIMTYNDMQHNIPNNSRVKPDDSLSTIKSKVNSQEKVVNDKNEEQNKRKNEENKENESYSLIYKRYKYIVESLDILHPDITFDMGNVAEEGVLKLLPEAIDAIIIEREYDKLLNPILEVKLTLPPLIKKFIIERKNDIKFRLRIQSVYYPIDDNGMVDETRTGIYNDIINDIFVTYTVDENEFGDEFLYNKSVETQDLKSAASILSNYTESYSLFLWKVGHVEALRRVVNGVYSNSNIVSVLVRCFNEYGIDKVLISPPDNQTQYSQIVIPPLHIMNLPKFIDENYGLYYRGTTFFYDFRCLYVLNRNGFCDAYENGEYKRTIITVVGSGISDTKRLGVAKNEEYEESYLFAFSNDMGIMNPSKVNDIISGSNMYVIDSRNNRTSDINNPNGTGTYRIMEDKFGNAYNKGQYVSNVLEENLKINASFQDYDLNIFTPNKEFVFNFTDSARIGYCGTYRLYGEKVILKRNGTNMLISGSYSFTWKRAMDESERISLTEKVYGPNIETESANDKTVGSETPKPLSETDKTQSNPEVTVPFDPEKDEAFKKKEENTATAVTDYKVPSKAPIPLYDRQKENTSSDSKKEL